MTPTAPNYRKQKEIALATLVGASLALGVIDIAIDIDASRGLTLLSSFAMLLIGFRWLQLDSAELDIRRPIWLNIGIVAAAGLFVPYYLYKTRPAGKRLPAIAGFFALLFTCAFAMAVGASLMAYFAGTTPTGA